MERRVKVTERVVSKEAIRRFAAQSAAASSRLEGRVVPPGYVRSAQVEQFLAERLPQD